MIDNVNAPASKEYPHFNVVTKNNIPKSPYTIDGIPDNVSVVIRITLINLFPRLAYSTRKIAEKIPNGTAMIKDNAVIIIVLIKAGNSDPFSLVYFNANNSGLICGIPLIKIYAIKNNNTANVMIAESITRSIKINDPGVLL